MFTQEQAAKYLIVAWVKEWSVPTYIRAIYELPTGTLPSKEQIVKDFPWMPGHESWYMLGSKGRCRCRWVRKLVADCYYVLNNRLWDAPDNAARLKLYPELMAMRAGGTKSSSKYSNRDSLNEYRHTKSAQEAAECINTATSDNRERTNRNSSWGTTK